MRFSLLAKRVASQAVTHSATHCKKLWYFLHATKIAQCRLSVRRAKAVPASQATDDMPKIWWDVRPCFLLLLYFRQVIVTWINTCLWSLKISKTVTKWQTTQKMCNLIHGVQFINRTAIKSLINFLPFGNSQRIFDNFRLGHKTIMAKKLRQFIRCTL